MIIPWVSKIRAKVMTVPQGGNSRSNQGYLQQADDSKYIKKDQFHLSEECHQLDLTNGPI